MSHGELYLAEQDMHRRLAERHHHADVRRHARKTRANGDLSERFYAGALAAFGDRLVAWGSRLREQHTDSAASPTLGAANRL